MKFSFGKPEVLQQEFRDREKAEIHEVEEMLASLDKAVIQDLFKEMLRGLVFQRKIIPPLSLSL